MDKQTEENIKNGLNRLKTISEELIATGVPHALLVSNPLQGSKTLLFTQFRKEDLKWILEGALSELDEKYDGRTPLTKVKF